MKNSKVVEISADHHKMRARVEPSKWSLKGIDPTSFSKLSVDVPEFVPGKRFTAPGDSNPQPVTSEIQTATAETSSGEKSPAKDSTVDDTNVSEKSGNDRLTDLPAEKSELQPGK